MISIIKKKRSKYLYVQFYIDGKCIQRSTKLPDTPKNRKFIDTKIIPSLELKILAGEIDTKKQDMNFEFYANKYLYTKESLKTYRELYNTVYNQLIPRFKNRDVSTIRRFEIKEFADDLLRNITPRRTSALLSILGAIFDVAIDYEVITSNPSRNIKLPKHTKKELEPFTPVEVSKILEHATGWFKVFVAISFYTGARTGEILALTWNDIDLDDRLIRINKRMRNGIVDVPKTTTSIRDVPIFDALIPIIKEHKSSSKSISLFINPNTAKPFYKTERLTPYWKKLLEDVGINYRILYSTRHTFITNMLKFGNMNMLTIAQIVGHSNTEMIVRNYARFIKGEHLKINRDLNIFTDDSTDTKHISS